MVVFFFFFNDTATTEIYTLSLPTLFRSQTQDERLDGRHHARAPHQLQRLGRAHESRQEEAPAPRSEEHTSELQSPCNLVCRLLLEKKKTSALRSSRLSSSAPNVCCRTAA